MPHCNNVFIPERQNSRYLSVQNIAISLPWRMEKKKENTNKYWLYFDPMMISGAPEGLSAERSKKPNKNQWIPHTQPSTQLHDSTVLSLSQWFHCWSNYLLSPVTALLRHRKQACWFYWQSCNFSSVLCSRNKDKFLVDYISLYHLDFVAQIFSLFFFTKCQIPPINAVSGSNNHFYSIKNTAMAASKEDQQYYP